MTEAEVRAAIKDGVKMTWNDPDPIPDNDYTVFKVFDLDEETALIHYGGVEVDNGMMYSEAEVYLTELSVIK